MQMKNRLTAVTVGIDDDAISIFGKAFRTRDFGGRQQQMSERRTVLGTGFAK